MNEKAQLGKGGPGRGMARAKALRQKYVSGGIYVGRRAVWDLGQFLFYFLIYFWLHWVFVAALRLFFSSCGRQGRVGATLR